MTDECATSIGDRPWAVKRPYHRTKPLKPKPERTKKEKQPIQPIEDFLVDPSDASIQSYVEIILNSKKKKYMLLDGKLRRIVWTPEALAIRASIKYRKYKNPAYFVIHKERIAMLKKQSYHLRKLQENPSYVPRTPKLIDSRDPSLQVSSEAPECPDPPTVQLPDC